VGVETELGRLELDWLGLLRSPQTFAELRSLMACWVLRGEGIDDQRGILCGEVARGKAKLKERGRKERMRKKNMARQFGFRYPVNASVNTIVQRCIKNHIHNPFQS
jgi:hypothetical protein